MPQLSRQHTLRRLQAMQVERGRLDAELVRLVHQLRSYQHPEPWRSIGQALGMSAQAVQQRFRVTEPGA
jgi:hypothetical protein